MTPVSSRVVSGLDLLVGAPDDVALVADGRAVSYADLGGLVEQRREWLGSTRRLVVLEGSARLDTLVTHLAALRGGHVVLLVPPGGAATVGVYDADVVHSAGGPPVAVRAGSAHDLHPDLALLLTTSGSTGSPKLVRLSHDNVLSNARAIASYLSLTPADRALTTLPMHYCYGLSVLHSHLVTGASVVLTEESVTRCDLWARAAESGVTSFAGVPHTFALLDAAGQDPFAAVPSLRYVTQAGGRLPPEEVRRWVARARERDVDFVVMYGQTEATARMAWLPPALAEDRPSCIGVPIPGGDLRIEPVPAEVCPVYPGCPREATIGELVYSGPNVMMGYAESPADLGRGREVTELRTGDLAFQHPDGLFEIVGRVARFAKVLGLRIDLDGLELSLASAGLDAWVVEDEGASGGRLAVVGTAGSVVRRAVEQVTSLSGLPGHLVDGHVLAALPRTLSGKPDRAAVAGQLAAVRSVGAAADVPPGVSAEQLRDVLAVVLGRPDAGLDDSFTDLRGDSLSFVEASTRLGDLLGDLPPDWPSLSPRRLAAAAAPPRRTRRVETGLLLRAVAIVLVVGSHAELFDVMGGSHLLLALLGWNLARFSLSAPTAREAARRIATTVRRIAVPTAVVAGTVALTTGAYQWPTVVGLNWLLGSDEWTDDWQLWFVEAAVWPLLVLLALVSVPGLRRVERRRPFETALAVFGATLALRFALTGVEAGNPERYEPAAVAWLLALGWLAARADTPRRRLGAAVCAVVSVAGFFGEPGREALIIGGVLLMLACASVRLPVVLIPVVALVADASLWIYLTHWQVYPYLEVQSPLGATLASIAVGIVCARLWSRLGPVTARAARLRRPAPARAR